MISLQKFQVILPYPAALPFSSLSRRKRSTTVHRTGRDSRAPKTHAASAAKEDPMAKSSGRGEVRRGNGVTRLAPAVLLAALAGVAAPSRTQAATCAPVDHGPIL